MLPTTIKLLTAGIAASIAITSQAQTAENTSPLEEIIVTSSRVPVPLRQIGISVSAISEAEIEAHGNLSLIDVLRQMPAIATTNNGGSGKATSLRIRGEEGFRTLTIFDGMRLSDPSGTQIGSPLQHLLSEGIGRVEILRGPQGLAYGADAGGVVNISSRSDTEGFFGNLNAQAGKFGSDLLSGNIGGGNGTVDYFVAITDTETDGYNARASDSVLADSDGYENTSIHARLGVKLAENLQLDLVHRDVDGDTEFDGCFSGTTVHDCSGDYELDASRASLEYTGENFSHSISYSATDTDRENFALGVSSFTANGELDRWEYLGSATNLPGFDLVFGADHEEAINNGVGRDNVGFYLEYLSDFSDNIFFTAGTRHDDNDDFGTNTSYRVSGAYLIDLSRSATLKFKGAYGTGFRAPSPFEIGYNAGAFAFPPASLVSLGQEESEGYELGVKYVVGSSLHLEAVYFDQEVEDAIFFDLAGFSGYLQDVGRSTSDGVEISADISLSDNLRLTSNYTYNDTERPNGLQRRRRPEQLANFGLAYVGMDDRLSLNAFYRISRDSIDEVGATLVKLDDFEVMDLSASYSVSDNIKLYARVENAFDEDYEEIAGFNPPDRAAYVGVRFNFSAR
ncbi:MAG: TonB-dependent receptor [Gammaproteobacteria bacterium]|jgi:vitamin B12 transporter|nr:TonB-dependent receptor [Gammaproteobacteria bacterium]HJO10451.1 TonB-dependent receptor [Gammaproteobacteria bacterium]|tara:strand:+ start:1639 stop:3510 length:1872 start_codon:yes stop_codon:yes gene_type:complete